MKTLEAQIKGADGKQAKIVEGATEVQKELRFRTTLLESSPRAERVCLGRLKKDRAIGIAEAPGASVDIRKRDDAVRGQLEESEEALPGVRTCLAVAINELERLRLKAKEFGKELTVAQSLVSLQVSLCKASLKPMDAKFKRFERGVVAFEDEERQVDKAEARKN